MIKRDREDATKHPGRLLPHKATELRLNTETLRRLTAPLPPEALGLAAGGGGVVTLYYCQTRKCPVL